MKIHSLFPTPVYETNLNREFTKQELELIKASEIECIPNMGNTSSEDNYILEQEGFKDLKKELEIILKDYMDKVVSPNQKTDCYITQSWLNYTETNGYHHIHNHPNSYLSGVLYFMVIKNMIKFILVKMIIIKFKLVLISIIDLILVVGLYLFKQGRL